MNHIGEETKKRKNSAGHHEMYVSQSFVISWYCDIVANVLASQGVYNIVLCCSIRFLIYDVCL